MSATGVKTLSEVVKELKERLGDQQALFDEDIKAFQQTVLDKYGRSASSDDVAKFTKAEPALMAKIFHTPKDTQFVIGLLNGIVADKTDKKDKDLVVDLVVSVEQIQAQLRALVKISTADDAFKARVRAYGMCPFTNERDLDRLVAAHIIPRHYFFTSAKKDYYEEAKDVLRDLPLQVHDLGNGILLAAWLEKLLDRAFIYFTIVSKDVLQLHLAMDITLLVAEVDKVGYLEVPAPPDNNNVDSIPCKLSPKLPIYQQLKELCAWEQQTKAGILSAKMPHLPDDRVLLWCQNRVNVYSQRRMNVLQ